jgi:signal transduction histidine kinase
MHMNISLFKYIYKKTGLESLKIDHIIDKYAEIKALTTRLQSIVLILVYVVVAYGYYRAGYYPLMALAFLSLSFSFFYIVGKGGCLSSRLAAYLFIYIPIANILVKDIFFVLQGAPQINVFFLHTHFMLLLFISLGGLVGNERNILYVGGISIVWIWIFTFILDNPYLWSIIVLDTVFFTGISFVVYFAYSSANLFNLRLGIQAQVVNRQNKELNELLHLKDWMLNVIVHDIKNPINRIISASKTKVIQRDEVVQPSEQILSIIENILDICKMEDSKISLKLLDWDIDSLIQSAFRQVKYLLNTKNISFVKRVPVNSIIKVDGELFIRALVNMLSNSIKFSELNSFIEVNVINKEKRLRIEVTDYGVGIDVRNIEKVFEKYYQVDARNLGATHSTGIGLTFCKFVIEAHGGTIGIDSILNSGTTVWFELPLTCENYVKSEVLINETPIKNKKVNKDEEILLEYKLRLADLAVYETSEIIGALDSSSAINSDLVICWKEEILKSSITGNLEYFNKLKKV